MTDDVRQALARRRSDAPDFMGPNQVAAEDRLLAAAYIAEHPADEGEALNFAWLEQCGGRVQPRQGPDNGYAFRVGDNGEIVVRQFAQGLWGVTLHNGCEGDDCCELVELPSISTRGDLRALCRCLGVELKGPT